MPSRATGPRTALPVLLVVAALALAGCAHRPAASADPTGAPSTVVSPSATATGVTVATFDGCPAPGAAVDVCGAMVTIPDWGFDRSIGDPRSFCAQGDVTLTAGAYPTTGTGASESIKKFIIADVDRDGMADAIVVMSCHMGDPPTQQVMVVGGTTTGRLRTLGQVVGLPHGQIWHVEDVTADADGTIHILVAARHGSDGGSVQAMRQWRAFHWDGQGFAQIGGSTSFVVDRSVASLAVEATPIAFAAPQGGQRHGTLTVTLTNTGTTVARAVSVQILLGISTEMTIASTDCPDGALVKIPTCVVGELAPGASRTLSLPISIAALEVDTFLANNRDGSPGRARIVLGDQEYSLTPLPKVSFR
jgi:hypothetical protein